MKVQKTKTWQIEAKPTWHHFRGKNHWIWTQNLKGELTIWKTKMQAKVQGKVQQKYSRIQFAPNES
jgi:hypothetical protein